MNLFEAIGILAEAYHLWAIKIARPSWKDFLKSDNYKKLPSNVRDTLTNALGNHTVVNNKTNDYFWEKYY